MNLDNCTCTHGLGFETKTYLYCQPLQNTQATNDRNVKRGERELKLEEYVFPEFVDDVLKVYLRNFRVEYVWKSSIKSDLNWFYVDIFGNKT